MKEPPWPAETLGHFYSDGLLATTHTSTLQKELSQAAREGCSVVGMASRREKIAILEKPAAE